MEKRRAIALAAIVLMVTAVGLASGVGQMRAALAQPSLINVSARERLVEGQSQGEVLVGNQVVLRIRASGGISAMQRANQVAQRLQAFLRSEQEVTAADFRVGRRVTSGLFLRRHADHRRRATGGAQRHHARASRQVVANNIAQAVTTQVAGTAPKPSALRARSFRCRRERDPCRRCADHRPAANGPGGVGPDRTTFQDVVRIRIFVPLGRSRTSSVPQVNVSAYGDIRLAVRWNALPEEMAKRAALRRCPTFGSACGSRNVVRVIRQ